MGTTPLAQDRIHAGIAPYLQCYWRSTLTRVGYEWLDIGLQSLRGVEPYEVMQVLNSKIRRPIPATGPDGHRVLTIWGRTAAGRGLIIAVRQLSQWDWQIISARAMTDSETSTHEAWEVTRDER